MHQSIPAAPRSPRATAGHLLALLIPWAQLELADVFQYTNSKIKNLPCHSALAKKLVIQFRDSKKIQEDIM